MSGQLQFPQFKLGDWIRKCDECGHKQKDNRPSQEKELTDNYCNRACKKCKSESLDYGQENCIVSDDW